ncbi:hypothetical protein PYCCODRAFT_1428490 [Trametes coccinea BRFM310]|uniref:SUN domain-containing protein n=1 Tax=Trametes coccinea (strain BRFM310) TaxID=1353009 RepID=A0A1Y2I8K5_TRAC3|nr:hypothetical protein PYCCODRAFT_1428490 [Trametes coccinea BRFM310]
MPAQRETDPFDSSRFDFEDTGTALAIGKSQPVSHSQLERAIRIALESTVQPHDFALASGGARIIPGLTSGTSSYHYVSNRPENVLTEGLDRDSCWLFDGGRGQVGIRLPNHSIAPTHIALDLNRLPYFYSDAPRRVVLWGMVDGDNNRRIYDSQLQDYRDSLRHLGDGPAQSLGYTFLALSEFEYDPVAPFPLQTHRVASAVVTSPISFGVLVLEVMSNWGGVRTGICRIRIHGTPRTSKA